MINLIYTTARIFILLTFITGIIYPLFITGFAQITMPKQANGSLINRNGEIRGSQLIAQKTTDDKYFWPRPSAIDYNPLHPSGGSNLGPTSKKLAELVAARKKHLGANSPSELLYSSASGLDPHISVEAAYSQIRRIALLRAIPEEELKYFVDFYIEGEQFGVFGPRYINVLTLNLALEEKYDRRS